MKINTPLPRSKQSIAWKVAPVVATLPLLGLVGAGIAQAATQTQTQTIASQTTDYSSGAAFSLFNPSLGTLTQVDWTITSNGSMNGSVTNTSGSPQNFKITEEADFTATGPNSSSLNGPSLVMAQTYSGLAGGATAAFGPYTPSGSAATTITGAGLSNYYGAGTFNFGLSTLTGTAILGGGGNITTSIATKAGATATVVYTYTPSAAAAPEPGSLALLALPTLSALGLVRWRRRSA